MGIEINASRLWQTIEETGRIGATPRGGLCRLALSDEDRIVRDWLAAAVTEIGCSLAVDELGNMFAVRPGELDDSPAISMGSHLDTQPTGGRFDGILGVLAGLEVLRTLEEAGRRTRHPIQLINWTNEEGARFAPAMLGSGVYSGALEKGFALSREDRGGARFSEELERIGYRGEERCGERRLDSYFELHIEQGPILENEAKVIGIVQGAQGMRWYELSLEGCAAHAGTTPMELRRDALVGAAQIVVDVNALATEIGEGSLTTCGVIESRPGSRNVVPSSVFLTVDLRHTDDARLEAMQSRLEQIVAESSARHRLESKLEKTWESASVRFDPECLEAVRQATLGSGQPFREITSGAGHDAVYVSRIVPTAMIFIPCKGGLSHNELESAEPEHVAAGASVLLQTVLERDQR